MDDLTTPILLDDFWTYQVVVLADQISRYTLGVVKAESELNLSQWRVLAAVANRPGCSSAEVTSMTPMDKTIVSRAVASLIRDGLINRTPSKHDKRTAALKMTSLGAKQYTLISEKLGETLNAAQINGQATGDFNAAVKHFSHYVLELSQNGKP